MDDKSSGVVTPVALRMNIRSLGKLRLYSHYNKLHSQEKALLHSLEYKNTTHFRIS